ncbi:MAG: penicillin-insensitive murein endopeptidase [Myxococcales bacterium]|nr:penicillin-insensitive murein endopeptidase [Myxococcales bacterium]
MSASSSAEPGAARRRLSGVVAAAVALATGWPGCSGGDVLIHEAPLDAGANREPRTGATAEANAEPETTSSPRREDEGPDRRPGVDVDVAGFDPEDDPELIDDYFDAVEDGNEVEPPPRPTGLPGDRAFSIGAANGGWLIGGKPLPLRGRHFRVLPGTAQRGWYFGTDALLGIIDRASDQVGRRYGGAPLRVGNMSRREGGKITPSVSHQNGRDVDIGIYATDLDGQTTDPGGFPKFDGRLGNPMVDTTGDYLFDVARNWAFVEALLGDAGARVQWIFLDDPLEEILLDHAVRMRVNGELIARAEKVIVRPKNSSPHANHFHVRIFCNQGDLQYGCKDMGPEWEWVEEARAVEDQLLEGIVDDVMSGRRQLDLFNPESEPPLAVDLEPRGSASPTPEIPLPGTREPGVIPYPPDGRRSMQGRDPGGAHSPDQLPDPPTDVQLNLK